MTEKLVAKRLPDHSHFTLAVVDNDGPWAVCLALRNFDGRNIEWVSEITARHSRAIVDNPQVAVCAFSKTDQQGEFGFYAEADASKADDINDRLAVYRATIRRGWFNDDKHEKIELDIDKIKQHRG